MSLATTTTTFRTQLVGYALRMRFKTEADHFFRLEAPAPNGCQWVKIDSAEQAAAASFLLQNLRRKPVELEVSGPIESFQGESACRLTQVGFGFSGDSEGLAATEPPPQSFFVDSLTSEEHQGVERRIFQVNPAKQGPKGPCDTIVFTFEERQSLESLLMQCLLGPRRFDFEIDRELGDGECTIRSLRMVG